MGVYFNGETITIPGAYSAIDVSEMTTKSGDNGESKIIALIGEAGGGEPESVQFFSDPVSAKKVLKSGDLLKACNKAWNPISRTKEGMTVGGANIIACIRTNRGTKGTLNINDGQFVFESTDWNAAVNQIQLKMVDGTLSGTKKLVVNNQATDVVESFDNIGGLFTIAYIGEEDYAELNIVHTNDTCYLQTKIGSNADSAVEDIKIDLDSSIIKNIKALFSKIQSYENYRVTISGTYNPKIKVDTLDTCSKVAIKAVEGVDSYRVTAIYADMQDKLSTSSSMVALASYKMSGTPIENFEYQFLEGGTDGESKSSWIEYFDMLSNFDITYIVPLTPDSVIHSELNAHCNTLSGNKGKERRMIVGGNINESVADTCARARSLGDSRAQVVHGGFYDYNNSNELELYPPYILAAQHAGRCAYLDDGEPATHDVYRMAAPEYKLEDEDITELLAAGCLAFEFVLGTNDVSSSYVRLVQDLTTDVNATDTVHTERATGVLADSINKEIRKRIDELVTGKRVSSTDLATIKNATLTILFNRQQRGHIIDYKDVYVTKTGTVTYIDYSVAPSEPNNFSLITAHYYSESLSTESTTGE